MKTIIIRLFSYVVLPFLVLKTLFIFFQNSKGMLPCSIKDLTGLDCPGCGGQRAISAILKGDFKQAFYYNELIYIYLIVIIYLYIFYIEKYLVKDEQIANRLIVSNKFAFYFLLIIILFMIIRNI